MTTGWFQGRRLEYNDTVTYRSAIVAAVNPEAPPQSEGERPYIGHIVDFTDTAIGVRADGWWGEAPLYYVLTGAILNVEPYVAPRSAEEERERARLARRERDVPVPEPDTPEALVATLADWGAEHRPHEPCSACGCTLWWTAAPMICWSCVPMDGEATHRPWALLESDNFHLSDSRIGGQMGPSPSPLFCHFEELKLLCLHRRHSRSGNPSR